MFPAPGTRHNGNLTVTPDQPRVTRTLSLSSPIFMASTSLPLAARRIDGTRPDAARTYEPTKQLQHRPAEGGTAQPLHTGRRHSDNGQARSLGGSRR
jgi:hypothetical protein